MKETLLRKDEVDLQRQMKEKAKDGTLKVVESKPAPAPAPKRRGRWDVAGASGGQDETPAKKIQIDTTPSSQPASTTPKTLQPWDPTPGRRDYGSETPGGGSGGAMTPSVPRMWDPTPAHPSQASETPGHTTNMATPGRRNRQATLMYFFLHVPFRAK